MNIGLSLIAASLALVTASAAAAQTTSPGLDKAGSRLDIFGTAPSACVLSPPTAATGANAAFVVQAGQAGVIRFTQFVDPQTSQPRASSINLVFPIVCNSAHRLIVRTDGNGLVRTPGAAPAVGFRDRVGFQVSADWAGVSASGSSASLTPIDLQTANGAAGQLNLLVDVTGGGTPLVAGAYAGTLIVELEASN